MASLTREVRSAIRGLSRDATRLESARALYRYAEDSPVHRQAIVDDGGVAALVRTLGRARTEDLKLAAMGALGHLGRWSADARDGVAAIGGIAILVARLGDATDAVAQCAAWAVNHVTCNHAVNCEAVRAARGIPLLLQCVRSGSRDAKKLGALALGNLAQQSAAIKDAIRDARGIPLLVRCVREPHDVVKETAAAALAHLAQGNAANADAIRDADGFPALVECVRSGPDKVKACAIDALREAADDNDTNCNAIREAGGIRPLVQCLRGDDANIVERAAHALTWLVKSCEANCDPIRAAGGIAPLVQCLRSDSVVSQLWAAHALCLMVTFDAAIKDAVRDARGIPALVQCARSAPDPTKRWAVQALGSIAYGHAGSGDAVRAAGGLAPLVACVRTESDELKEWAANALSVLAYEAPANRDAIRQAGGVPPLVQCVRHGSGALRVWAVRALANVACDSAAVKDAIRDARGIPALVQCVQQQGDLSLREQAVWALIHTLAESRANCTEALRHGVEAALSACLDYPCRQLRDTATLALSLVADPDSDAHRFVDMCVVVDADLGLHLGPDLIDWAAVPRSQWFRLPRRSCENAFLPTVCAHFGVSAERVRFWVFAPRDGGALRPSRFVASAMMRSTFSILNRASLLGTTRMLMEVSPAEEAPFFAPEDTHSMVYFKFYDACHQLMQFVLRKGVHVGHRVDSVAEELRAVVGLRPHTPLRFFEEVRAVEPLMVPLSGKQTFGDVGLGNGHIVVFQVHPERLPPMLLFPTARAYFDWIVAAPHRLTRTSEPVFTRHGGDGAAPVPWDPLPQTPAAQPAAVPVAHSRPVASIDDALHLDASELTVEDEADEGGIRGVGRTSTVYRGTLRGLVVAVKVFNTVLERDELHDFVAEARTLMQLRHPGVVQCFGCCLQPGRKPKLVMEFMDASLEHALRREPDTLSPRQRLLLLSQVADTLAFVHVRGCVHGDLKPGNILLTADRSTAKLGDFGTARLLRNTALTSTIGMGGTPVYMAPELAHSGGSVAGGTAVDTMCKADVYSVAVLMWETLTGQRPYADAVNSMQLLMQVCMQGVRPDVDALPAGVVRERMGPLLARMWSADVGERPHMSDVAEEMRAVVMAALTGRDDVAEVPAAAPAGPDAPEADECVVCMDMLEYHTALIPCGHTAVCAHCVEGGICAVCPLCRTPVQGSMLVYF